MRRKITAEDLAACGSLFDEPIEPIEADEPAVLQDSDPPEAAQDATPGAVRPQDAGSPQQAFADSGRTDAQEAPERAEASDPRPCEPSPVKDRTGAKSRKNRKGRDDPPQAAEKSIKEEALELFRRGYSAEEAARELMLPPRAVKAWEALYLEGNLLKFGKAREEAAARAEAEPALFAGAEPAR